MLAEFQKVIESPTISNEQAIEQSKIIICAFIRDNFTQDQNFQNKIANLNKSSFSSAVKLYRIVQAFLKCLEQSVVPIEHYQALQNQTQKLEATCRNHIKIQYEMKMFMEHLQAKNQKLEQTLQRYKAKKEAYKIDQKQLQLLKSKQKVLMKEKIHLIKRNQELLNKLEQKEQLLNYKYNQLMKVMEAQSNISRKNLAQSHEKSIPHSNRSKESSRKGFTQRNYNHKQKLYKIQVNSKNYDPQLLNVQSLKIDKNIRYYTNQSDLTQQKPLLLPEHVKFVHPSTNDLTKKKSSGKLYYVTKKPSNLSVSHPYFQSKL